MSVDATDLLAAASRLLAEYGPEALTVRRIAHAAGCSTMAIYSHFGGKNGVVDGLFQEGFRTLIEALDRL
ncbi:MAG: TetR/AcrR family transcriptional regulator, partial [Myxococcota bacterium]